MQSKIISAVLATLLASGLAMLVQTGLISKDVLRMVNFGNLIQQELVIPEGGQHGISK